MLWTAAIMVCMTGQEPSYKTCEVMNAEWKYRSEAECMVAVANKLNSLMNIPEIDRTYEPVNYKCVSWIEESV